MNQGAAHPAEWSRWFLTFSDIFQNMEPRFLEMCNAEHWRLFVIPGKSNGLALLALNPDAPQPAIYVSHLFDPADWTKGEAYAHQRAKVALGALKVFISTSAMPPDLKQ